MLFIQFSVKQHRNAPCHFLQDFLRASRETQQLSHASATSACRSQIKILLEAESHLNYSRWKNTLQAHSWNFNSKNIQLL